MRDAWQQAGEAVSLSRGNNMRDTLEKDVQKRIAALTVFYTRAVLETHILIASDAEKAMEENRQAAEGLLKQYRDILKNNGEIFSPQEVALLNMPFGSWTDSDTNAASWSSESFGVLKWAIGMAASIPEYDVRMEAVDIGELDFDKGKLRTKEQIEHEFERGKKWNWRVGAEFLNRHNPEAYNQEGFPSYKKLLADSAEDALNRGLVEETAGDDLKAFGKPVEQLSQEELATIGATAYARQKALAWMLNDFENPIKAWDAIEGES